MSSLLNIREKQGFNLKFLYRAGGPRKSITTTIFVLSALNSIARALISAGGTVGFIDDTLVWWARYQFQREILEEEKDIMKPFTDLSDYFEYKEEEQWLDKRLERISELPLPHLRRYLVEVCQSYTMACSPC